MLKLKRHHHIMLVLLILFVISWMTWTFYLLPRSEMRPASSDQVGFSNSPR